MNNQPLEVEETPELIAYRLDLIEEVIRQEESKMFEGKTQQWINRHIQNLAFFFQMKHGIFLEVPLIS